MNVFVIAAIISVIYLLMKFVEMRLIEKENKPLKLLIRDALVVYFSVIIGYFIIDQLKPLAQEGGKDGLMVNPPVFTDNPGF
jgi:hypothetical protein